MIPVGPHLPASAERAIDRLGNSDRETLNTAPESARLRLDEEMDVVVLDAEVEHPKRFGRRLAEAGADGTEDVTAPERRNFHARSKGDVHRPPTIVSRTPSMKNVPPTRGRRSPRPVTSATPCWWCREFQLVSAISHLE